MKDKEVENKIKNKEEKSKIFEFSKYLFLILLLCFIVIPVLFNFLIMWDSGLAKGESSDWFTFYGNIVGGLIGGSFTYLALIKTLKRDEEKEIKRKEEEMDTKIRECILNNKTYINTIEQISLSIQRAVVFKELEMVLYEFIENDIFDFNTNPELKRFDINVKKYKELLLKMNETTVYYEKQLKQDLIDLSGNDFFYFQHNILNFINRLKYITYIQLQEKEVDYEVLSDFIVYKDNFGFKSIISKIVEENDELYSKYINEDIISDYLKSTQIAHIKG